MAMLMLLRRMKVEGITVHGFRSSFRDWCGDKTTFPREIAEAALAHKVGNEVERAYRRSDALEIRRALMQEWADFVGGKTVIEIQTIAVAGFLEQIKPHLVALPKPQQDQIADPLKTLEAEVTASAPDQSKLRAALSDVREAAESASGNLVAAGIAGMVGQIVGD